MRVNDDLDKVVLQLDRKQRTKKSEPAWVSRCILGETGKPLAVLANALIVLRTVLPELFIYDAMLCAPISLAGARER